MFAQVVRMQVMEVSLWEPLDRNTAGVFESGPCHLWTTVYVGEVIIFDAHHSWLLFLVLPLALPAYSSEASLCWICGFLYRMGGALLVAALPLLLIEPRVSQDLAPPFTAWP